MRRRVLIPLMLAVTFSVSAQVYWRRPVLLPRAWRTAYQAPFRLQEGRGDATFHVVDGTLPQIKNELSGRHGSDMAWRSGENVAWGLAVENGRLHRYLVQPLPNDEGFWVMHMEQRVREAGRPGAKPSSHQLREVPAFPQSRPTFYSLDEGTQLALEVSSTPAAPDAVLDQLTDSLRSAGWMESPMNTGGMRMFVRRDHVVLLGATRARDGNTRVVRLHKPLGVER